MTAMNRNAATVKEYLDSLPEDRRKALGKVRTAIRKHLPKGYKEGIQYGMIGWFVPHSIYPDGYHCKPTEPLPFAGLASQKNHMSLYLMCMYNDEKHLKWFTDAWKKTGRKLDMGKSCIRFKSADDLPLDVIGEAVARIPVDVFIAHYESAIKTGGKHRASKKKTSARKKTSKKKAAPRKTARKSTPPVKKATTKKSARKKSTRKKTAKKSATRRTR